MENGRGHGSHRRQPDSEPVFCTPGSRLTGYGRGSAVSRPNESISDRPTRSSILGSSSTVLESSTSVTPTVPTNSRYSDLPPISSHSRPINVPTLQPPRPIVKRPFVNGSYNGHVPQVPIQQPKTQTVPIDQSLIEAALNNPHIQELIAPVTQKLIAPVTQEPIVPVTQEPIVPVIQEVIAPVTGNPFQTADTQELVKQIVTIKNEMNKVSRDAHGLEALIKKTCKEIQCKNSLLNSLIHARESIQSRLNGFKEQEDHIFTQLCKDQTVTPPEVPKPQNLLSRPTQSAATQSAATQSATVSSYSALGTLSAGSSSSLPVPSAATVESSPASAERVPSPASSCSSDSSGPITTPNGQKNVSQSLPDRAVRVGRKRAGEVSSADASTGTTSGVKTSTGTTSGVKTSTPVRIGKRRKENGIGDGQGGSVADPQSVLAAVIRPASAVRASSSGATSVKEEPMGNEFTTAGPVQTTMILPETASEARIEPTVESEPPAGTVPTVNRPVTEAKTVTNHADSLPIQSTHETSTALRTTDSAAAKSVAPTATVPKSKSFPLKSINVQDPVPFKVKPEPANHYPGEEELGPQVTGSRPLFTSRSPSPPEEDEGSGILSMLSKSNQL